MSAAADFETDSSSLGWSAQLRLRFEARGEAELQRTVLADRTHHGPLRILKPLYPEGGACCHAILVHPPGGIVGGDQLDVQLDLQMGAQALVTTPGAQKWYRSAGACSMAKTSINVSNGAALEWMPQESMIYCGAFGEQVFDVNVSKNGAFWGWELLCAGRSARGEQFLRGQFNQRIALRRDGRLLWLERMHLKGGDALLNSTLGLQGQAVIASAWLLLPEPLLPKTAELLTLLRDTLVAGGALAAGASAPEPGLIVLKIAGPSAEAVRNLLIAAWTQIRWPVFVRLPVLPRIWST